MSGEPSWEIARRRRTAQLDLRRTHRVIALGTGPDPSGGGWPVGPDCWVRCVVCGYLLHLDGSTTDQCWCGAMASDAGAARIGSDLGDAAIERVRLDPVQGAGRLTAP